MKIKIIILALIAAFLVLLPGAVLAKEAVISDVVVTNSSTDLLLYLKVENAFTPELLAGVQNGLPITFSYQINLDLVRSAWLNKNIYAGRVDYTLAYDNLKKEYSVQGGGQDAKFITTDLAVAQKRMAELNGVVIVPLKTLEPDRQYILKARVVLDKKSLPFHFNYLLPFSLWDLKTDWYSVEFRY
ncbi:MAG: DUF4390 domain-containing protein [Deltaproteobacteria bacterium]|nr:DUF4390 domain-containing protein [Deltaproteobacteria bacterium]